MQQVIDESLRVLGFLSSLSQFFKIRWALQTKKSVPPRVHLRLTLNTARLVGLLKRLTFLAGLSRCSGDEVDEGHDFSEARAERFLKGGINSVQRERGRMRAAGGR